LDCGDSSANDSPRGAIDSDDLSNDKTPETRRREEIEGEESVENSKGISYIFCFNANFRSTLHTLLSVHHRDGQLSHLGICTEEEGRWQELREERREGGREVLVTAGRWNVRATSATREVFPKRREEEEENEWYEEREVGTSVD
jgi:hypothetical protein